jgi:uncharacterized BrkB/YihY/UPF0761 family membrane protein
VKRKVSIKALPLATVKAFISDNVMSLSATLSYYTLLSFAPLMVLTVWASSFLGLGAIWGMEARPGNAIWGWLRRRIFSVGLIAALGFILIVSLLISAALGLFLPHSGIIWEMVNILISAILYTALFAGSVIILMVWVYYSSAIFFLGAEFVQAKGEVDNAQASPLQAIGGILINAFVEAYRPQFEGLPSKDQNSG